MVPSTRTSPYASTQYSPTTPCVSVGLLSLPCVCLPQYEQCASNICCLKKRFRSYEKLHHFVTQPHHDDVVGPRTVDLLMDILKDIKKKISDNH
ncbi:hypothetical protein KIN20_033600 [Parelaphostrongylus tenuis]|uniref:Uncharacterized protein n=1 Tax=Parelaphostrongylus tenuis TaxID=148309 RepID=A0AAD5WID6_PARTN|nr:hypothetical protein KIN20_033600 [Parelaphostrongylus tenuis]